MNRDAIRRQREEEERDRRPLPLFDQGIHKPVEKRPWESLEAAFRAFHFLNPDILDLFRAKALEIMEETGRSKIGAKAVMEAIRWQREGAPDTEGSAFHLPNAHTAFYARLAAHRFPELRDAFRFASQNQAEPFDPSTVRP